MKRSFTNKTERPGAHFRPKNAVKDTKATSEMRKKVVRRVAKRTVSGRGKQMDEEEGRQFGGIWRHLWLAVSPAFRVFGWS